MGQQDRRAGHPEEAELILHRYGDAEDAAAIDAHMSSCDRCRVEYEQIGATLELVSGEPVPHRGEEYGRRVWNEIAPRLAGRPTRDASGPRFRWAMAAAVAVMVIGAFLAGRFTQPTMIPRQAAGGIPEQVRERILLVALGDHLERSQMMLVELLNADGGPNVDMTIDRQRAEELVADGRIYGQRAAGTGDTAVAVVLEELERILLDVAHGPQTLSHAELEAIQKRIQDKGILLKVRLIGSSVRQKEKTATTGGTGRRA